MKEKITTEQRIRKVALYIRKKVKRPRGLPAMGWGMLRWGEKCPMGMLPQAITDEPTDLTDFSEIPDAFTNRDIIDFAKWWDRQKEAKEAVDFVWGKAKNPSKKGKSR